MDGLSYRCIGGGTGRRVHPAVHSIDQPFAGWHRSTRGQQAEHSALRLTTLHNCKQCKAHCHWRFHQQISFGPVYPFCHHGGGRQSKSDWSLFNWHDCQVSEPGQNPFCFYWVTYLWFVGRPSGRLPVGGPAAVVHHLNSCPLLDYFVTPFEPLTVLLAAKCDNLDRFFMSLNSLCSWE